MSTTIINVPTKDIQDDISDDTNFEEQQDLAKVHHEELMCKLDDLNNNLKILATYFAIITDQTLTKDDV